MNCPEFGYRPCPYNGACDACPAVARREMLDSSYLSILMDCSPAILVSPDPISSLMDAYGGLVRKGYAQSENTIITGNLATWKEFTVNVPNTKVLSIYHSGSWEYIYDLSHNMSPSEDQFVFLEDVEWPYAHWNPYYYSKLKEVIQSSPNSHRHIVAGIQKTLLSDHEARPALDRGFFSDLIKMFKRIEFTES